MQDGCSVGYELWFLGVSQESRCIAAYDHLTRVVAVSLFSFYFNIVRKEKKIYITRTYEHQIAACKQMEQLREKAFCVKKVI